MLFTTTVFFIKCSNFCLTILISGETNVPLPKQSDVFKSESYANFIFLYFKIATEINVFNHLGHSLLAHVKESILNDKKYKEDSIESESEESDDEVEDNNVCDENHNDIDFRENIQDVEEKEKCEIIESIIEDILLDSFKIINSTSPKTVTSLYGKVYVLKPSIKSL